VSMFKPVFDTYQDVKTTLAWWSSPIWAAALWVGWRFVLDSSHREWLVTHLPHVAAWAKELGVVGVALASGVVIAQLMVHVIEIHDHIYDRYFVKWRRRYDGDFIIPKLLAPAGNRLPEEAIEIAVSQAEKCMNMLFYHFAADRDMKINKNLVVRFYERITKYWLTQLAEVAVLLLFVFSLVYSIVGHICHFTSFSLRFAWQWLAFASILVGIELIARRLRAATGQATEDEIQAIQDHPEFKSQLAAFCAKVGIDLGG